MKTQRTIIALLAVCCCALTACSDPEPMPVAPVAVAAPEPEPEPEPPQATFPKEDNALMDVAAMNHIPAKATFVAATANPTKAWEMLGAEDPEPGDYGPAHQPELLDISPSRLKGGGLDPERPVGIVIFGKVKKLTDGPRWAVFAAVADEGVFREAFGLMPKDKKTGLYKPKDLDDLRLFYAVGDEIIIFNRAQPVDAESSLAADVEYDSLVNLLDYGSMFTALIADKRGMAIFGAGVDDDGFGIKSLADTEAWAATVRIKGPTYVAGLYAQLPFAQRIINRQAELAQAGQLIRHDIDKLERKPLTRRVRAAKALPSQLQEIASLDGEMGTKVVAGRRWVGSPADVPDAYKAWVALGYTEEENLKMEELISSMETLHALDGADPVAMAKELGPNGSGSAGLGMQETMLKMSSGIIGGGNGKKKGGGGGLGMFEQMGNLGGMLGGGKGAGGPGIKVSSSDGLLKKWATSRMGQLAMCFGKSGAKSKGKIRANITLKPDGSFKVTGVRGKDAVLNCVRKTIGSGGKVRAREIPVPEDVLDADGNAPEGYQPTAKEWISWNFSTS